MAVNLPRPDPKSLHPVCGVELGVAMAGIRKPGRKDLLVMRLAPGTALLTGYALAARPQIKLGVNATNNIILVTVNGHPADALDDAGNLFAILDIRPGQNRFDVVVTDSFMRSTTNTLTLYGATCPNNFFTLGVVSASLVQE